MLIRFCLYGFLKNQRYFEPFLVLALLEKGLSFFQIGLLITIRELTCILLEIPSGAIADVCGRRGSMMLSFVAYFFCFGTLGYAQSFVVFIPAMVLYGVGDAFRTGTHKSMIFAWLRDQGREDERTRIYGLTRSWSKMGSAFSGLLAAGFVIFSGDYQIVFYAAMVPCIASLINFSGYPASLESGAPKSRSPKQVWNHLRGVIGRTLQERPSRRLVIEAMGYEGTFESVKDYLQPVLAVAALGLLAPFVGDASEVTQTALMVGPVYTVLFLLSAQASRRAHVVVERAGDHAGAARFLWAFNLIVFTFLAISAWFGVYLVVVIAFVVLYVAQNLWRPILISRFDACTRGDDGATVLSVESLAKRVATMVLAPLLGFVVDQTVAGATPYWPIGILGALIALSFYLLPPLNLPPKASI